MVHKYSYCELHIRRRAHAQLGHCTRRFCPRPGKEIKIADRQGTSRVLYEYAVELALGVSRSNACLAQSCGSRSPFFPLRETPRPGRPPEAPDHDGRMAFVCTEMQLSCRCRPKVNQPAEIAQLQRGQLDKDREPPKLCPSLPGFRSDSAVRVRCTSRR